MYDWEKLRQAEKVFLLLLKPVREVGLSELDFQRLLEERANEFRELVHSAYYVREAEGYYARNPKGDKLLGAGNLQRAVAEVKSTEVQKVIVDCDLTPNQEKDLQKAFGLPVLSRSGLILEIFSLRAHTSEGKLQVELAQLKYQSTRLVRSWTHLERQRGRTSTTSGPGETQIELDRRSLKKKIVRLEKQVAQIMKRRSLLSRSAEPMIALVGYTNAGKTTLFNKLASEDKFTEDLLFATLDPCRRKVRIGDGPDVIISDTVGFVRDIPHELIAAFKATLNELTQARLLVITVDLSDEWADLKYSTVDAVLKEIGVGDIERILVFTKGDKLSKSERTPQKLEDSFWTKPAIYSAVKKHKWYCVSSFTSYGLDTLSQAIMENTFGKVGCWDVTIPPTEGKLLAGLFKMKVVEETRVDDDGSLNLKLRMPRKPLEEILKKHGFADTNCYKQISAIS